MTRNAKIFRNSSNTKCFLFTVRFTLNWRSKTDELAMVVYCCSCSTNIKFLEISHENPDIWFFFITGCFDHTEPATAAEHHEPEWGPNNRSKSGRTLCEFLQSACRRYPSTLQAPARDTMSFIHGIICRVPRSFWIFVTLWNAFWFLVDFFYNIDYFRKNVKMDGLGALLSLYISFWNTSGWTSEMYDQI